LIKRPWQNLRFLLNNFQYLNVEGENIMQIPTKKILVFLLSCLSLILIIHAILVFINYILATEIPPFINLRFNISYEGNIPTWFSSVLLFAIGIYSLRIASIIRNIDVTAKLSMKFWSIFGIAFVFLSLDEAAQIHEIIDNITTIKWVKVYAPFAFCFIIICYYYLIFKKSENEKITKYIIMGLAIYITGALIFEYIGYKFILNSLGKQIEVFLEEGFEMLGVIIVLTGTLTKLNSLISKFNSPEKIKRVQ
jgi:hypothetical protein